MRPSLFDHSACKLSLSIPLSVCSETSPIFSLFFSPPLSLLSQQKSIPVHSLCQHLPTFPSVWLSSLGSLYWKQTVSLSISTLYRLLYSFALNLFLTKRTICWMSLSLSRFFISLISCLCMKSFLPLNIEVEPRLLWVSLLCQFQDDTLGVQQSLGDHKFKQHLKRSLSKWISHNIHSQVQIMKSIFLMKFPICVPSSSSARTRGETRVLKWLWPEKEPTYWAVTDDSY